MSWYLVAIIYLAYLVGYMIGRLAEFAESKKRRAALEAELYHFRHTMQKVCIDKKQITAHFSARKN